MNTFLAKLLDYYHLSEIDYLALTKEVNLSNFSLGYSFKDIDKAVDIVNKIVKENKRILIYGDYDCDGIMGISILVKMFLYKGINVSYYVPSRYIDGYGLNIDIAKKCINRFDLVITVDNGIVANEAIDILKENNINVIVIDHHSVQLPLPNADMIIHPEVSSYGDIATSGAYSAFMFSITYLGYVDKYLATLAAISLISDMMPLHKYNRNLLRAVFASYIDNEFLSISLLANHQELDENVIAMSIAPKINAIGRMITDKSINHIIKYFISDDKEFILSYFNYMTSINEERKEILKDISKELIDLDKESYCYLLDVKEGLIGLLANSVMNNIKKPVIVFTKANEEYIKGSARSVEGFNIVEAFKKLEKYLTQYGGHALAGGCEMKISEYENFKKDFKSLVDSTEIIIEEKRAIEISINDISYDNYLYVKSLSPFGEAFKAPIFKINHLKVDSLSYSRNNEHILTQIGNNAKIVGFYLAEEVYKYRYIDVTGKLSISKYKDKITTEFHIDKITESN